MGPIEQRRQVCWLNQEEWEEVLGWLYADDGPETVHLRDKGVRRVKAWAARGALPHAIDSTASLVQIWLRDSCGGRYGMSDLSESELRHQYNSVFLRFVNGVVDANQKGMYAIPVANIADQLGLPAWFVELRHAGTHSALPSLALFRASCQQALQWLHTNYWLLQKTYVADVRSEVHLLLTRYKAARKQTLKGQAEASASPADKSLSEITTLITSDTYSEILIPMLSEPGFLVPMARKKRVSVKAPLPASLSELWTPALAHFDTCWPGFSDELYLCIMDILNDPSNGVDEGKNVDAYRTTLVAWAKYIIQYFGKGARRWDALLESALKALSPDTVDLLECMAESKPGLADRIQPHIQLVKLVQADDGVVADDSILRDEVTDADITYLRQRVNALTKTVASTLVRNSEDDSQPSDGAWKLYSADEWRSCPIGCLPGGVIPDLGLPEWFNDAELLHSKGILCYPSENTTFTPANPEFMDVDLATVGTAEAGDGRMDHRDDWDNEPDENKSHIDLEQIAQRVILL
ncbi:Las1-like-domain-containing protein [Gaertneriomyces semiglobifer]|nr:Las1-like-domain-containing protein [Gaertneriomyces semiglobifer]